MPQLIISFSRPRDDAEGPTLGPFPWMQVTYTELRVGPDGDPIAMLGEDGDWHLGCVQIPIPGSEGWVEVSPDLAAEPWSDFTISPVEDAGEAPHA